MRINKFHQALLLTYFLVDIAGCGGGNGENEPVSVITPTPPIYVDFTCEFTLPSDAGSTLKAAHDQHSNNNVALDVLINHAKHCVEVI